MPKTLPEILAMIQYMKPSNENKMSKFYISKIKLFILLHYKPIK